MKTRRFTLLLQAVLVVLAVTVWTHAARAQDKERKADSDIGKQPVNMKLVS